MSATDLPDDLDAWPSNPYQLLGVTPGVTFGDLRRAYTRLIRRFKPEQHPDHFRRIRDAFDLLSRFAERPPPEPEAAEPAVDVDAEPPAGEAAAAPHPWTEGSTDDLEEIWPLACRGEEAEAYRRLVALHERRPGAPEVLLRLYWLLVLFPQLAARSPLDWLTTGLVRQGAAAGPLRELYRREILVRPGEALSDRFDRLLAYGSGTRETEELLEWRWSAASHLKQPQVIVGDLQTFRDRIRNDDEAAWLRLLVVAAEQLTAVNDLPDVGKLIAQCGAEADQLGHLAIRCSDLFDRLELLCASVPGLLRIGKEEGQTVLWRLLSYSWGRSFDELRPLLEEYLAKLVQWPRTALLRLHQIGAFAPTLLGQMTVLLRNYQEAIGAWGIPQHDAEVVTELVRKILLRGVGSDYARFRMVLLDYCLTEGLSPEQVANGASPDVAEQIHKDLPLHAVCWGCRLFRG